MFQLIRDWFTHAALKSRIRNQMSIQATTLDDLQRLETELEVIKKRQCRNDTLVEDLAASTKDLAETVVRLTEGMSKASDHLRRGSD